MRRTVFRCVLLWMVAVIVSTEPQCPVTSKTCTCDFSDSEDGGADAATSATSKSELLAAAAGAMSPLLIGGAGLGIWKLVKGRGEFDLKRSPSTLSDTSSPPSYKKESIRPPQQAHITPKPAVGRDINAWMDL